MADDPLSAALEEIRERNEQLRSRYGYVGGLLALAKAENDVPRLLAVLDVVLAAHRNADGRCAWCRNQDGQRQKWPCGEYLAITRALTGEAGDA